MKNIKRHYLSNLIFGLLLLVFVNNIFANEQLNLYVGEVKVINVGEVERVAVGKGDILSTSILKNGQLIILAEAAGDTKVHIWRKNGRERQIKVSVLESDTGKQISEINALLKDIPSVNVRAVGGRPVIEGTVDDGGAQILEIVSEVYPDIINLTNLAQVGSQKMIYMNVQITEFNTGSLSELGINWQTNINGPSLAFASEFTDSVSILGSSASAITIPSGGPVSANSALGYFGIATEITSRINFAVNSGEAFILASPVLSARSGGEAEFVSGGEVPIPVDTGNGTAVEFKEYGIILRVKPRADNAGNIVAEIETELSTVDDSVSVNNTPGFRTRRATTDVSLRDGQTLVVSKLVSNEISSSTSGIKGLANLPILGALFRSENFNNNRSELVIFITPQIVDANSAENIEAVVRADEIKAQFLESINKDESILD